MAHDDIERLRSGGIPTPSVPVPDSWRPPETPAPEAPTHEQEPGPAMSILSALGAVTLAVLACVPHLVAPAIALIVSLVALPIAFSMRRISTGKRQRLFITAALVLGLTIVLSIVCPLLWMQAGVIPIPQLGF